MKLLRQRIDQKHQHKEVKGVQGPSQEARTDRMPSIRRRQAGFLGSGKGRHGREDVLLTRVAVDRLWISRGHPSHHESSDSAISTSTVVSIFLNMLGLLPALPAEPDEKLYRKDLPLTNQWFSAR